MEFVRNPHTLEDSWWDGPQRFQWVNRNVISMVQHEGTFKYIKALAPNKIGVDIGGLCGSDRSTWSIEGKPYTIKLNIDENTNIVARGEELPFKDETIGYIVSFHTFEHIKGDPRKTVQEWLRVLIPNGLLGIVMPDKRFFLHDEKTIVEGRAAYNEMEPQEMLELFSGLNVEVLIFDSRKNNFDFDILIRKNQWNH